MDLVNNNTSFYSRDELIKIGFKSLGSNVQLSRKASIYNAKKIEIGNHVRIDDFCILSGTIKLGNNIHISAFCGLYGAGTISMEDYSGLSPRTTLFSASDDFSGDFLIGPLLPEEYTNVKKAPINIGKYCQLGAGCIVLPNVTIGEGVSVGAISLVNKDLQAWKIYKGIPAKYYKERSKLLLNLL